MDGVLVDVFGSYREVVRLSVTAYMRAVLGASSVGFVPSGEGEDDGDEAQGLVRYRKLLLRAGTDIVFSDYDELVRYVKNVVRDSLAKQFILVTDINLDVAPYNTGIGWECIDTDANPFTGRFDGGGHTISNLYINKPYTDYVGLFGHINGVTIRNVGLVNASLTFYKSMKGRVVTVGPRGSLMSPMWTT